MRVSVWARCSTAALALLAALLAGCAPRPSGVPWAHVREATPAFLATALAADPSLAVDRSGRVALTWVTRDSSGDAGDAWLSVSADSGSHWSAPARLNLAPGTVSSYPESRPVAAWGRDGSIVAAGASKRTAHQAIVADLAARCSQA